MFKRLMGYANKAVTGMTLTGGAAMLGYNAYNAARLVAAGPIVGTAAIAVASGVTYYDRKAGEKLIGTFVAVSSAGLLCSTGIGAAITAGVAGTAMLVNGVSNYKASTKDGGKAPDIAEQALKAVLDTAGQAGAMVLYTGEPAVSAGWQKLQEQFEIKDIDRNEDGYIEIISSPAAQASQKAKKALMALASDATEQVQFAARGAYQRFAPTCLQEQVSEADVPVEGLIDPNLPDGPYNVANPYWPVGIVKGPSPASSWVMELFGLKHYQPTSLRGESRV